MGRKNDVQIDGGMTLKSLPEIRYSRGFSGCGIGFVRPWDWRGKARRGGARGGTEGGMDGRRDGGRDGRERDREE